MSGKLITIVPPTLYDFGALGTNQLIFFVLGSRIDVTGVEEGVLQVRLHSVNIANAADTISVEVDTDGYTADDPGQFQLTGATLAIVGFTGPLSTSPSFSTVAFTVGFGGLVKVALEAIRGNSLGSLRAKLSVDLMLRSGGPARTDRTPMSGTYLGY